MMPLVFQKLYSPEDLNLQQWRCENLTNLTVCDTWGCSKLSRGGRWIDRTALLITRSSYCGSNVATPCFTAVWEWAKVRSRDLFCCVLRVCRRGSSAAENSRSLLHVPSSSRWAWQLHRTQSSHPPVHHLTAAALRTVTKETPCSSAYRVVSLFPVDTLTRDYTFCTGLRHIFTA